VQSNHGDTTGTAAGDTGPTVPVDSVSVPLDSGSDSRLYAELLAIRTELGVLATREQERAAHREAVIDRLHSENQALRQRDLDAMLDPVRSALYRVYDMARREAERWSGPAPPAAEHVGPLLAVVAEELCEVLARTGVEPFTPRAGEPYDPTRHRPVDTADVADEALDGTVVRTLSDGFTRGETIARRADVVIGQLRTDQWTRPRSGG